MSTIEKKFEKQLVIVRNSIFIFFSANHRVLKSRLFGKQSRDDLLEQLKARLSVIYSFGV